MTGTTKNINEKRHPHRMYIPPIIIAEELEDEDFIAASPIQTEGSGTDKEEGDDGPMSKQGGYLFYYDDESSDYDY